MDEQKHNLKWWLELIRVVIAAICGLLGGAAM